MPVKKNLKDSSLCEVARTKAKVAGQRHNTATDQASLKYRDRASERRLLHNQPELPNEQKVSGKRSSDGPQPVPSPPTPPPVIIGKDDSNIGNKLLKMMGWTEGSGLGTEGGGRVDPV